MASDTSDLKERLSSFSFSCDELFDALQDQAAFPEESALVKVLQEIYETEEEYCNALSSLIDGYMEPILHIKKIVKCKSLKDSRSTCIHNLPTSKCTGECESDSPVLDRTEISTIFSNVADIAELNKALFGRIRNSLKSLCKSESESKISVSDIINVYADAFKIVEPHLHIYIKYCSDYAIAQETLSRCESENIQFNEFLLRRGSVKKPIPPMKGLLVKPVSRLSTYPKLFSKLLAASRPYIQAHIFSGRFDQDPLGMEVLTNMIKNLEDTHGSVRALAERASIRIKDKEAVELTRRVSTNLGDSSLGPNIEAPWRRFITSDSVHVVDKSEGLQQTPMTIYLFNDTLVLAKHKEGQSRRLVNMLLNRRNSVRAAVPLLMQGRADSSSSSLGSTPRRKGKRNTNEDEESSVRKGKRTTTAFRDDNKGSTSRSDSGKLQRPLGSDSSSKKNGRKRGGKNRRTDGDGNYKVYEKMEMRQVVVKPLIGKEEDGLFAFNILFKKRETYDKSVKDKDTGLDKVVQGIRTIILGFDVYFDNREKRDALLDQIDEVKNALDIADKEKEKAKDNFGLKRSNRKRWAKKKLNLIHNT